MPLQPEGPSLWYIRKLNFFPAMTDDEVLACAKRTKMEMPRRGEEIALPSDNGQYAWLIKEGRIRLLRNTSDGRSLAVDILGPGEVIGETTILTGEGGTEYAEALEDSILCRVSAQFLRDLCENNPQLSLQIGKKVGEQRLRIENRLSDMLFCTVPIRIAKLLRHLGERFGKPSTSGTVIDIRLTHQEIADLVGANREAATRAIDRFLDEGLIGYEGKQIVLKDLPGLTKAIECASC